MKNQRKSYLPSLILALVLWGLLFSLVFYVEPTMVKDILFKNLYLPFFLILLPASFVILSLIFGSSKRGFLITMGLVIFLMLRIFELGNILNFSLIAGIVMALDRS